MGFGGSQFKKEDRKAEENSRVVEAIKAELSLVKSGKKKASPNYMIIGNGQAEEKELFRLAIDTMPFHKHTTKMELIFDGCYLGFRAKAGFNQSTGCYQLTENTCNGFIDNLYLHKQKPLSVGFMDHFDYWFRVASEFLEPKIIGENRIEELQKLGTIVNETIQMGFDGVDDL